MNSKLKGILGGILGGILAVFGYNKVVNPPAPIPVVVKKLSLPPCVETDTMFSVQILGNDMNRTVLARISGDTLYYRDAHVTNPGMTPGDSAMFVCADRKLVRVQN